MGTKCTISTVWLERAPNISRRQINSVLCSLVSARVSSHIKLGIKQKTNSLPTVIGSRFVTFALLYDSQNWRVSPKPGIEHYTAFFCTACASWLLLCSLRFHHCDHDPFLRFWSLCERLARFLDIPARDKFSISSQTKQLSFVLEWARGKRAKDSKRD